MARTETKAAAEDIENELGNTKEMIRQTNAITDEEASTDAGNING